MKPVLPGLILICVAVMLILFSAPGGIQGPAGSAVMPGDGLYADASPAEGGDALLSDVAWLDALRSASIANPVMQAGDPYRAGRERVMAPPDDRPWAGAVCGVRFTDPVRGVYEIRTLRGRDEAERAGYLVTHGGYCGTCSTLRDLVVYLERRDLTYAVRSCSFRMARRPMLSCLREIGFSEQCALTWYYNIRNTGRRCLGVCLGSWLRREPLNRPDGSLNACLQCDEEMSGPIFKYWAGRTRRNSGIRSEIGRGAGELFPVTHDYLR